MFAKFFRPKWQSNKADVRIRAISRMLADNPEQQEILSRLAQTDQNIEVRKAALARLIRPEPLLRLLASELDPAIRHSASEHLCKLITDAHSDLSAEQRLRCIEGIQDQDLLTHIALHSQQAQLQQAAVAKVRDESNLEVLALNAQSAQTRRLAAERLEAEEVLERIGRKVRQRDKAVYRITRDKLQQMRDAARALEELRARRLELVERFEQLAQGELLPQYAARIDALGQEWQKLEPGQDDLDSRYRQAVARCQERAAAVQAETEARERRQQQQNAYRQARSALIEQLETLEQQCRQSVAEGNFDYSELQCTAEQWLQQWQALPHGEFDGDTGTPAPLLGRLEQLAASADAQEKIAEQLDRLLAQPVDDAGPGKLRKQQQQLESLLQRVNWPDGLSRPESLKRAEKRLREIDSRRQALNQQSRALQQSLQEQLDSLEQAIAEGHVKQAGKHHQRAADALELLNGQAAGALDQRFRQLHAQLQELRDWQGFAVTPKKEQLCADMEALIDSELPTPERAEAIRRLQQQWKDLDSTDAYHSQALWRRFKEASDRAYAPCEDYFLALGEQRRENLKQRGIICEQLETYIASIDWDAPDWKGIETISRAAKQEWKHYSPVDRGPGKELQQRFNGLLQQLDGRLQGHFQQCLELKRDLVARTAALCDAEDPHQAARDARQLQQEWKAAGKTYRNQEQRLWKQFRSHCDSIFARLSDSQQQHRQQQDEQREQAESACQQLEQLLDRVVGRTTIATALAQARETFDGLDQAFCASFARRFDKAAEQLARQCRELEELQASAGLQALERRAGLCDELESLLGADSEDSEPLAELQQNWRALPACSSEFSELIEQRYQLVLQTLQEPDLLPELTEAAGERLRQLCIQLEIALGLPSPDEDQALRLEYQMQRLQQALEQHSQTTRLSDLQRLEYEWRCIPLARRHPELTGRFYGHLEGLL